MIKKEKTLWMAACAAILFGMSACGHKEASSTVDSIDSPVAEIELTEEVAVDTVSGTTDTVIVEEVAQAPAAEKNDYVTTPSGLKYKVLKKGTGRSPKATDIVKVNYEGKLVDGTVFDSSYKRGEPATFPLNRVIAGWTEGLQLMQEGAVYELYIPYRLAYGENGGGPIPPKSDLIFKVELIEVQ